MSARRPRPLIAALLLGLAGLTLGAATDPATAQDPAPAAARVQPDAVLGAPVQTVLAADSDRTVVQVAFPILTAPRNWQTAVRIVWTGIPTELHHRDTGLVEPIPAVHGLHVAVAGRAVPTWRIAAVQWYRQPADPTAPVATVGAPLIHRGVSLAPVQIMVEAGGGVLAGVILEIQHPAPVGLDRARSEPQLARRALAEPIPGAVVNGGHYRNLRTWSMASVPAGRATLEDPFDLSGNWVRLEVVETGVHTIGGRQLELLGLNLAAIDPASLRLYKGGGLELLDDPELADSEQADRAGLNEIAIVVDDGGDGEFNADDRVLFYGFGTDVWRDRLEPGAETLAHYTHPFADRGVYWLTWTAVGTPSPLAGDPRRIATVPADPSGVGDPVTTHLARYHGEQNLVYLGGFLRDSWAWQSLINTSFNPTAVVHGVVPGSLARWQIDYCGIGRTHAQMTSTMQTSAWINDDQANATSRTWTMLNDQQNQEQLRIAGVTTSLRDGANTVRLRHDNFAQSGVHLAFDSFDLLYLATLDKRAYPGALQVGFWPLPGEQDLDVHFQLPEPAAAADVQFTLPASGAFQLWDVTDPREIFALAGTEVAGPPRTLTVFLVRGDDEARHLVLFGEADVRPVAAVSLASVRPLRRTLPAVDYVVIHPAAFATAAERLAELRSRTLPGVASPAAVAVSVEDIYANFSGGQKDWRAIRRFLRWSWLEHGQRLQWVCLLGDASRDYRNFQGRNPATDLVDWVPTDVVTTFPVTIPGLLTLDHPYATDESLVALDAVTNPDIGIDMPDLAVGRLSANSAAAALALVERVRVYVEQPPAGPWRNRVTWCADDLDAPNNPQQSERQHTQQAEALANLFLPASLEIDKVYLVDYPRVGQYKPAARRALISSLDAGTTMFYYVGHGAAQQLADEQVFLTDFIPGLTNAGRRFVFVGFSCDVGEFDNPGSQSMAELFLAATQGGGIGAIAASWVSFISFNNTLSNRFFEALYPGRSVDPDVTLGRALIDGKIGIWTERQRVRNARRYNFFGDPALRLVNPVDDLAFTAESADSLLTGRLHVVQIDLGDAEPQLAPGATYQLLVQESSVSVTYYGFDSWRRLGNTVFRGSGSLTGEQTSIPFLAPLNLRTGPSGRIRLLVSDPDGGLDRAAFLQVPVVQTASGYGDDVRGPDIRLAFAGNRLRVQPGAVLTATLSDSSGINILASNPANSVLIEFDDSGVYANVSDAVIFEPGSYTRASLTTSLPPDLALGPHKLVMTASDMFGNVGSDTLRFHLEAAGIGGLRDATVFPNPTPGPCRLVCDLTAPMDLRWDIYTVAGRRIRSVRAHFAAPGPAVLHWDGRDGEGDEIANGTYLYVLRGTMAGAGHEIRETGQLVIMR